MPGPRRRLSSREPVERPDDLDASIPFPPMEAELVRELPEADGWQYEPKWDGFRGILENTSGELRLWSRNARPLLRYFPELQPLAKLLPPDSALDGEIVIERDGVLDFDAMQTRLHPAESRINRLSGEIPARFVAFDILVWKGEEIWQRPLAERRGELERKAKRFGLSPASRDRDAALAWLDRFEAIGLDGVIAKRLESPYLPGSREAVVKVKPEKTADCVVVGLRWKSRPARIATLLLGLYDERGEIDYVGSAAVAPARHTQIAERVLPLLENAPERRFSEPNRWGGGELEESPVRPELVVEVRYDKVQSNRFRHGTKLIRFRDDKDPAACTWRELRPVRPRGVTVASFLGAASVRGAAC
ncbi:MAG: ATP-dependent DNA ligase [Actinobacteria bacterium]|nr:ATP-dependent DNA ligase [Actinomycetota bacterium]